MTQRNVVKSLLVAMTILLLGACSESYPGLNFVYTQEHDGINNQESGSNKNSPAPIMVFTSEQDVFTVTTRGLGTFDNDPDPVRLKNSEIYVYAFRSKKCSSTDNPKLLAPTDFRYYTDYAKDNIYVSSNYLDNDKINCMLDGEDYRYGVKYFLRPGSTKLLHTSPESDEEDSIFYYGTAHQDIPFNFFAYYLDDAKVLNSNPRSEDGVAYELELDGTQDIMCGVSKDLKKEIEEAESTDEEKRRLSTIRDIWPSVNQGDKELIRNIGGYCNVTAHVNIHPMVEMKHLLTRLDFRAYPGDTTSTRVIIRGIKVKSKYKGKLTVASFDREAIGFDFYNEREILSLCEKSDGENDCPPFRAEGYRVEFDKSKGDWKAQDYVHLGSCLLLPPDSLYTLYIDYDEKLPRYNGDPNPQFVKMPTLEYVLRPTEAPIFESGRFYPVNIVIYGSREIQVNIGVTPWEPGGAIDVDDPEIVVESNN